jgi:hypothetical protein
MVERIKMKICLIWGNHYDDKPYHTHHSFWEATLKDLGIEFVRYTWGDWQIHMKPEYDLYFFIDFHPCLYQLHKYPQFHPRVFYWWDCFHHSFCYPAQITEMFDRAYLAEYNTAIALQNQGLTNVFWLPPAFYEGCYHPININKIYDFSFIGQPDDTVVRKGKTRKEFFIELQVKYPKSCIVQSVWGEDVNKIYNQSRILVDRTIYNNVGTRVFETIGSGGFTLVNRGKVNSGIDKLAIDGAHFISYDDSLEDCIKKMEYYLNYEAEREKITKAGYKHFLINHTYSHRLDVILKDFGL